MHPTLRIALILTALAAPAQAAPDSGTPPGVFENPQAIKRIEGENLAAAQSFECTWYADAMVRETETDSPARGQSYLVRRPPNGARPACPGTHVASDIPLDKGDRFFIGRQGPFFFYEYTDSPQLDPFFVWHEPDGRMIYQDTATDTSGFKSTSVIDGVLHLTYVRAYDAPCSLIKEGAACWAKAMKAGHFARAVAAQPPPIASCAAPYKKAQDPDSDPSTITYTVEMTLTADGKATILSRGPPGCEPAD